MTETKVELKKVKLKRELTHQRKLYKAGETIEVTQAQAVWLKSLGTI
tara:strand:+ start:59 stop:199 length:141 start_codon:yes stop_codon:yes gene_type:complete